MIVKQDPNHSTVIGVVLSQMESSLLLALVSNVLNNNDRMSTFATTLRIRLRNVGVISAQGPSGSDPKVMCHNPSSFTDI